MNLVRDGRIWGVIGLLALALLIWFGGPLVRFGENNAAPLADAVVRLSVILVIVIVWGFYQFFKQYRHQKNNDDMLDEIQKQQAAQSSSDNQSREELNVINNKFQEALSTLRKTRFKTHQGGQDRSLYELPWYIIIGPPGSGKTTALVNSGLEFPLADKFGKGALQGIGGTRHCDWWFTNEAVLIDTAGRYTTQDSHREVDSKSWLGFVRLLKKYRKRRPINGIIIAISIQDLLTQTPEERATHAHTVRSRIEELNQELGIRFPIYTIFTKCDLLAGFSEYFDEFGRDQREQVWGVTFPFVEGKTSNDQFFNLDYYANDFDDLVRRINERLLWVMHRERDPKRRSAIHSFPLQLEALKEPLLDLLKLTFEGNLYQGQPQLRGVYFSSATQQGTPIDRIMATVSSNYGVNSPSALLPKSDGKSFFIERLFKDVIFTESGIVGVDSQYEKSLRFMRTAFYGLLGVISVGTLFVWGSSFTQNQLAIADVNNLINQFSEEKKSFAPPQTDWIETVSALNALEKADAVYDKKDFPWLVSLGMYDPRVDQKAESVYQSQSQEILLPRLKKRLENKLKSLNAEDSELMPVLKAYLMLSEPERFEKPFLMNWVSQDLEETVVAQSSEQKDVLRHLDRVLSQSFSPLKLDSALVERTRDKILTISPPRRIYSEIKQQEQYAQRVDLRSDIGDGLSQVFQTSQNLQRVFSMPYIFTKPGYDSLDFSGDSNLFKQLAEDRWILGDKGKIDYTAKEMDDIAEKTKALYISEYSTRWQQFINQINVKSFSSLRDAAQSVGLVSDPVYSPLLGIVKSVAYHTHLTPSPELPKAGGVKSEKANAAAKLISEKILKPNQVDFQFKPYFELVKENKGAPIKILGVMNELQSFHDFLNNTALASSPDETAFEVSKNHFQGSVDGIRKMYIQAENQPKSVKRWLKDITDQTWKLHLSGAKRHLNQLWIQEVYNKYINGLANSYPLRESAKSQASLLDFSEFFKPGGIEDSFVKNHLSPFLEKNRRFKLKVVDGLALNISSKALTQFGHSARIRSHFFRENPEQPQATFTLTPISLDQQVRAFEFSLNNQFLKYTHGPKFPTTMSWPGTDGVDRSVISFEDLNSARRVKEFEGPWSFFKVLDFASLEKTKQASTYILKFRIQGRNSKYRLKAKSSINPFNTAYLRAYRCPKSL